MGQIRLSKLRPQLLYDRVRVDPVSREHVDNLRDQMMDLLPERIGERGMGRD
ncbi:hypothetical protein D3C84_1245390 [compost metagenome]